MYSRRHLLNAEGQHSLRSAPDCNQPWSIRTCSLAQCQTGASQSPVLWTPCSAPRESNTTPVQTRGSPRAADRPAPAPHWLLTARKAKQLPLMERTECASKVLIKKEEKNHRRNSHHPRSHHSSNFQTGHISLPSSPTYLAQPSPTPPRSDTDHFGKIKVAHATACNLTLQVFPRRKEGSAAPPLQSTTLKSYTITSSIDHTTLLR